MQTKNKDTNKIVNYDYELGKLTRGKEEKKILKINLHIF